MDKGCYMNIKPIGNKVALKEFNKESTTGTGLVIVGSVENDTPEFGVIAVGPDVTDVKVGDKVLIELGRAAIFNNDTLIVEDKFITAILE